MMIPNLFLYTLLALMASLALLKELILLSSSLVHMFDEKCDPDSPACCVDC